MEPHSLAFNVSSPPKMLDLSNLCLETKEICQGLYKSIAKQWFLVQGLQKGFSQTTDSQYTPNMYMCVSVCIFLSNDYTALMRCSKESVAQNEMKSSCR